MEDIMNSHDRVTSELDEARLETTDTRTTQHISESDRYEARQKIENLTAKKETFLQKVSLPKSDHIS